MRRRNTAGRQTPGNGRFFFCSQRFHAERHPVDARALGVFLSVFAFAACSSSDPQILQIDARLIAGGVPHQEEVEERLSVFVDVYDPDGEGELDTLTIAYEDFDLSWNLDGSTWRYHPRDGQHWYGSDRLRLRGRSRMPRDTLVVTVIDLSGREASQTVTIPTTVPEAEPDAFARIADGNLVVPADARRLYVTRSASDASPISTELEWPLDTEERIVPWSSLVSDTAQQAAELSDGTDIFLIVEWSPWLWMESGPWRVEAAAD